jgi:acetoin utilization deacetylase AcuC-like enzyme
MTLPVYYTPRMVADSASFSPSAAKPAQVVAAWRASGLAIEVVEPAAVTVDQLARAHDREHVERILACQKPNGFGNRSPEVAATLVHTSGAMLSAARRAIADGAVACAPVSGFHHAMYRTAGAFCTFNGLMVAALALHREDGVGRVGILDYDMHVGNGTDDIIARTGAAFVVHFTAGMHYDSPSDAARLLAELPERARAMAGCEVVLYQAGADQHVSDPLGGVLTTAELQRRDEIVFGELAALGIPVAWNLAGGYQVEPDGSIPKVLEIHENTARAALAAASSWRRRAPE